MFLSGELQARSFCLGYRKIQYSVKTLLFPTLLYERKRDHRNVLGGSFFCSFKQGTCSKCSHPSVLSPKAAHSPSVVQDFFFLERKRCRSHTTAKWYALLLAVLLLPCNTFSTPHHCCHRRAKWVSFLCGRRHRSSPTTACCALG